VRVEQFEKIASSWPVLPVPTAYAASWKGGGLVSRTGKWAEHKYKKKRWPAYPAGAGHAANRALVSWIVNHSSNLETYQGEDVSLGIWMDEAPFSAKLVPHPAFEPWNGDCFHVHKAVVGHNIPNEKLEKCFKKTENHGAAPLPRGSLEKRNPQWEMFVEVTALFEEIGASWALFAGTLLEFVRDHTLGNSDIDFMLDFKWWKENERAVEDAFKRKGYVQYYNGFKAFGSLPKKMRGATAFLGKKGGGPRLKSTSIQFIWDQTRPACRHGVCMTPQRGRTAVLCR